MPTPSFLSRNELKKKKKTLGEAEAVMSKLMKDLEAENADDDATQ